MKMTTTTLAVAGMHCGGCVASVTHVLEKTPGVTKALVDLSSGSATVHYDADVVDIGQLIARIDSAGYEALLR